MGTHPIFESDFDCLTETQSPFFTIDTGSRVMRSKARWCRRNVATSRHHSGRPFAIMRQLSKGNCVPPDQWLTIAIRLIWGLSSLIEVEQCANTYVSACTSIWRALLRRVI